MTTLLPDVEANWLADQVAARIGFVSLHTASPALDGSNELSGGSPAYARKAVTFNAAGAVGPLGSTLQPATVGVAWSNEVTFDVPAGTYTHWGAWSLVTGGVYRQGNTLLPGAQTPSGQTTILHSLGVGPFAGA